MRIGMGQGMDLSNNPSGVTVTGYPALPTPTPDQIEDALNQLPNQISTAPLSDAANPYSYQNTLGAPTPTVVNWEMVALIVGGLMIFILVAKR